MSKFLNDKDFFICTGGLQPTQMQTPQMLAKKITSAKYLTKDDTSTVPFADFSCKKLMLLMAVIVVIIAALTIATGGAVLIAAAVVGGAVGAVVGSLICGHMGAPARTWIDYKQKTFLANGKINALTDKAYMKCAIFNEEIRFAPHIKNWWQANLVRLSNFAGEMFKCAMVGAAAAGIVVLASEGILGFLGNAITNWGATFSWGGIGLRSALGANQMVQDEYVSGKGASKDSFTEGFWSMETGTAHSAKNIVVGETYTDENGVQHMEHFHHVKEDWKKADGVDGSQHPVGKAVAYCSAGLGVIDDFTALLGWGAGANTRKPTTVEPEVIRTEEGKPGEEPKQEEAKPEGKAAEKAKEEGGAGDLYEDAAPMVDPIQKGFEDLAARRKELGLVEAGAEGDMATLSKLKIGNAEFEGINSKLQNPKTKVTLKANAQTKTHAEAEVTQKAIDAGKKGTATEAEMWTDRDACDACGKYNGIGSLVRELGVEKIIVHSPSGTKIYYPPKTK